VGELWFDTSSDFLTVMFRDSSRFVVCADQWTEYLSDLVCVHAGCKCVHAVLPNTCYFRSLEDSRDSGSLMFYNCHFFEKARPTLSQPARRCLSRCGWPLVELEEFVQFIETYRPSLP